MNVICVKYKIYDQDISLEFFAYLTKYRDRFASVRIN